MYLPRAGDVTDVDEPKRRAQPVTQRGERQRVLVVDDEVRSSVLRDADAD